ncbi:PucR C-terminal helix-turn-helix domain-containing protein [Actinokineospora alba]|uniref:PucR C-terminal helix-turn-helix domain-containing protein n=1 Tax=Actinokineospora alba TaxID=504798 RepID=A0A1H0US11_9PSEU|nr:helix-turn-helix domain-containing protein [Actinokineospora alba]TDP69104.1 PucR-like helix-turn-helix protein [Actinokineospora alba]SDI79642.1 PucR C-terminal helix-turn-helix domain-containing protein [Actinokineospora alba]SDP68905.1 PucR C-terminal helix-turn-helix domain-containing protein [Actinokineospora alba]
MAADRVTRTQDRATALWASLPRDLVVKFHPMVGRLTQDMIREIQHAVPEYARPLKGHFGAIMTAGVEQAVLRILDTVGVGGSQNEKWAAMFRQLGRVEFAEGRSLDCLQTAYRVGGRVAWRHVAAWGQQQRLPTAMFTVAAEAIFAYVDEISALSIEGYTAAQAESAGVVERRRQRLLDLLLADEPASPKAVAALAGQVGWQVPDEVSVIVVEHADLPDGDWGRPTPPEVLMDLDGDVPCVISADPDAHLPLLTERLRGRRLCVGPVVPLATAPSSLRWARRAMDLVDRGVLPDREVLWCRDHLSTLWLLGDEFLIEQLYERALAPLTGLTDKQRTRASETMLAWLETRGSAPEMADKLNIHPQTVRYRMKLVEKLFGDQLDDSTSRLDLEIALRAGRLLRSKQDKQLRVLR